jgi:hypothetical protein
MTEARAISAPITRETKLRRVDLGGQPTDQPYAEEEGASEHIMTVTPSSSTVYRSGCLRSRMGWWERGRSGTAGSSGSATGSSGRFRWISTSSALVSSSAAGCSGTSSAGSPSCGLGDLACSFKADGTKPTSNLSSPPLGGIYRQFICPNASFLFDVYAKLCAFSFRCRLTRPKLSPTSRLLQENNITAHLDLACTVDKDAMATTTVAHKHTRVQHRT